MKNYFMSEQNQDPTVDQRQSNHAYNWLDDHGQISYERLIKVAQSGSSEDIERLHELADDNNISYDDATDLQELAEEIYSAVEADKNVGVE